MPHRAITSVTSPTPVSSLPYSVRVCVCAALGSRGENTALSFHPTPRWRGTYLARVTTARERRKNSDRVTRWKSGRETILCDREEEEWNREERGEKESERPAPTRQLSWYSMTSNNSQKLSTTERVIKSKQHKYFSYNRDREGYIIVHDIQCQLGFVRVSVRAILTCVYVCMALRPRLFRLPRSVRQFTLTFLDLHSFSSLSYYWYYSDESYLSTLRLS